MKLLFLHGWKSTPGGLKPTFLKDHGSEARNPALPDDDFDAAVRIAQAEFDQRERDVVVGSSCEPHFGHRIATGIHGFGSSWGCSSASLRHWSCFTRIP